MPNNIPHAFIQANATLVVETNHLHAHLLSPKIGLLHSSNLLRMKEIVDFETDKRIHPHGYSRPCTPAGTNDIFEDCESKSRSPRSQSKFSSQVGGRKISFTALICIDPLKIKVVCCDHSAGSIASGKGDSRQH